MAAPLITGYDCSITVGETVFDDVVASFELSFDTESLTYNVLSGPRAAGGSESGSLNLTWAYDSGETRASTTRSGPRREPRSPTSRQRRAPTPGPRSLYGRASRHSRLDRRVLCRARARRYAGPGSRRHQGRLEVIHRGDARCS